MNRDHALQILKDIFPQLQTYGVRDVALFGSVARNDALGNRRIHDYMGINFNIVVNVWQNEIPQLSEQLKGLLSGNIPKERENG